MTDITPPDIEAMGDVLDAAGEQSDSMGIAEAIDLLRSIEAMMSKARAAQGLLQTQLVDILESPRVVDGVLYEVTPARKWTSDHDTIKAKVVRWAAANEDGEVVNSITAADRAVTMMYDLFIAPGDFPKTGGLKKLGVNKSDVGDDTSLGKKLKTTKVAEADT